MQMLASLLVKICK